MRKLRKCRLIAEMLDESSSVRKSQCCRAKLEEVMLIRSFEHDFAIGRANRLLRENAACSTGARETFGAWIAAARRVIEHESSLNRNSAQIRGAARRMRCALQTVRMRDAQNAQCGQPNDGTRPHVSDGVFLQHQGFAMSSEHFKPRIRIDQTRFRLSRAFDDVEALVMKVCAHGECVNIHGVAEKRGEFVMQFEMRRTMTSFITCTGHVITEAPCFCQF